MHTCVVRMNEFRLGTNQAVCLRTFGHTVATGVIWNDKVVRPIGPNCDLTTDKVPSLWVSPEGMSIRPVTPEKLRLGRISACAGKAKTPQSPHKTKYFNRVMPANPTLCAL